jgi:hypothetical protein
MNKLSLSVPCNQHTLTHTHTHTHTHKQSINVNDCYFSIHSASLLDETVEERSDFVMILVDKVFQQIMSANIGQHKP